MITLSNPSVIAPGDAERYYTEGYWRDEDLWTSVQQVGSKIPDKLAFITEDGASITFGELLSTAANIGAGLRANGVAPGEAVIVHARNSIEAIQALLACAWLGVVMTPAPPMFSEAQIAAIASSSRASAVISLGDPKEVDRAIMASRRSPSVRLVVVPDACLQDGTISWSSLPAGPSLEREPNDPDMLSLMVYSSGTTGAPKGVMHSANSVRYAIEERAAMHDVSQNDICIVVCQFGFVGGVIFGLLTGPIVGTTSVLMRSWDPAEALALIERHRVSYGLFMPTHVHDLLASHALDGVDVSSLARAAMGGISKAVRLEVSKRLCSLPLPGYGMSECLGDTSCSLGDPDDKLLERDGRPYPGTVMRVVGDDGQILPAGEPGAIEIKGPSCFLGYFDAPDLTAAAVTPDGFFRTGDLGMLDPEGYLTFVGRAKDIIRRGGVTIVPADVEEALMAHPNITRAALVGLPDLRLGERACACIISRDGSEMTLDEITSYLERRTVAKYMWPEQVEMFGDFPETPSLKVKKPALVEAIAARKGI